MKVKEIYHWLDTVAPFATAESFDNCGVLVGDPQQEADRIGLALDITTDVIRRAEAEGITLIITHHPVIFHPMKSVLADTVVYQLIRAGIAVISAHTNLDKAEFGVNSVLAKALKLTNVVSPLSFDSLGRIGELLHPIPIQAYAEQVKEALHAGNIRYLDAGRPVKKVACSSGSGASLLEEAVKNGADTFVTGDVKHDVFVSAKNAGINLIDAGHFDTENIVLEPLRERMRRETGTDEVLILSEYNDIKTV